MGRAPCCDKTNVKKGPWSPEEDAKLKAYMEEHGVGGNWIALPEKVGLKRCGKSCRLRWLNYLRPDIRHGGFSEEEDKIICNLYISIGSRWSIIAAQLPGRTDNDIKNYWNTRLKKKLLGRRRDPSQSRPILAHNQEFCSEPSGSDQYDSPSQNLSVMALERMQLHLQLQGLQNPFASSNNHAVWPAFNPLASTRPFQGQPSDASSADINPVHQEHDSVAPGTHYEHSWNPLESDAVRYPAMGTNMEEEFFQSSNFNFIDNGIQADDPQLAELDFFQEMDNGKKVIMNCPTNGVDENSSSSSSWHSASALQPDFLLQEYMLGCYY